MRSVLVVLVICIAHAPARAQTAGWTDVPALVASATAPVEAELRACLKKLPASVGIIASRTKKGTAVAMPFPNVGIRGFTEEERCLMKTIAKIELPELPAGIERIYLGHTVVAAGAPAPATEAAFDAWRDPGKTVATLFDDERRTTLAACDRKPRTVRLVLDVRRDKTRVWLPAWQFHSPSGDGSTPPAQQKVKACLTKAIRGIAPPVLPRMMGELELALAISP
ncbi:MAG: hypothetical protein HOV81_41435 [Kofleriaceae bacterium]|nr:hypothetical protein [Kofleriaceae bacterium]